MSCVGCVRPHLSVLPTTRASTSSPFSSSSSSSAKLLSTSPLLTRSSPRTTLKTMAQSQPSSNQQDIGSGSEQQKVVISNSHGEKLVGILHETGSRELVVFCHGFRSSKETITGVNLAAALTKEGISAFRFDFSGNGESEGSFQYGNYRKEADDLRAVVQYFSGGEHEVSAIAGHSKGGNVVLLYASMYHDIPTVVNISGRYALDKGIGVRLGKDFMQRIKKDGYIDVKDKTGKVEYRVTEESLMDRLSTDMHAACLSIEDCRVLTVHGSVDEIIPVEDALEITKLIPNHKLHVIEGADHGYTSHQAELISTVLDFIRAGLQQGGQKPSQVDGGNAQGEI
eukprot:TRINITY_DN1522_c0_g1_i3.p1 TRINITY_DN1522_c0_g1~~TRINITY_DN1522_c0_g1_i3.p1  ORF type:complete len:340 (+),score=58.94 TRINITY_DN1522_c0_g1_i3:165-1184(+)